MRFFGPLGRLAMLAPLLLLWPALAGAQDEGETTLERIADRGRLICGVNAGLAGFATADSNQLWSGFEVEFCRALAAATLGDPALVDFRALPIEDRFGLLIESEVDVVARASGWSVTPDAGRGIDLAAISFYDQLGFLLPVELGVTSPRELNMASICVPGDPHTGPSLEDFFRANTLTWEAVPASSDSAARQMYLDRACDTYARAAAELYAVRATFETPAGHIVVTDAASRVPSGPVVREGDDGWADVVRWTFNALLTAEELGITSANVREMAATPATNPEINRLLGTEGQVGATLGLAPDWAVNAIAAGGNYGEIFERNIGENTPLGLARGLNALWTRGGLQYAPPLR